LALLAFGFRCVHNHSTRVCSPKIIRVLQIPNLQSLAHSVNGADVHIPSRRSS
jgi:hypothetical protein